MKKIKNIKNQSFQVAVVILSILVIVLLLAGNFMLSHNTKLKTFERVDNAYSENRLDMSPNLAGALESIGSTLNPADFKKFTNDFKRHTGIPVSMSFLTLEDLDLKLKDLADFDETNTFEDYCRSHYDTYTGGASDYLCIMTIFDGGLTPHIVFVPGAMIAIDFTGVDQFYETYGLMCSAENYKFDSDDLLLALNQFETSTIQALNANEVDDHKFRVGVYTPSETELEDATFLDENQFLDRDHNRILGPDHQYRHLNKTAIIPQIFIILVFAFALIFFVGDIVTVILFLRLRNREH